MLSDDYIQHVMESKDAERALAEGKVVGWASIDGAVVIYDLDDPPVWLPGDRHDG